MNRWAAALALVTLAAGVAGAEPCAGKAADCKACDAGEGAACGRVARDTPADRDKVPWYQRGCDLGDADSCAGLSWAATFVLHDHALFARATGRERELRAHAHARAADKCAGHVEAACLEVAIDLMVGRGVAKDHAAGVALLGSACGRRELAACRELAHADELAPADRVRYGKQACATGEERTCGDLVGLFNDAPLAAGEGAFARATLGRLCSRKDGTACWVLSGLWWTGKGGRPDRGRAGKLIAQACKLDRAFCDTLERWKRRQTFFADLGTLPTLNVQPLIDSSRSPAGGRPSRRAP